MWKFYSVHANPVVMNSQVHDISRSPNAVLYALQPLPII